MRIKESILRKLIKENLLLEAIYKQKDLVMLNPQLFDIISKQFSIIDPKFTLDNEKSPGRFFIDILYQCMKELLGEFDLVTDARNGQFLEKVENICIQLVILFQQKEVSSSTVQTGETFRDYIYKFMSNPTQFVVKNYDDRPIPDMITKLKYVYNYVMSRIKVSGPERIMQFINIIKLKDTYYPFGDKLVDGKYLVVCPLNIMSSIFWARTNIKAENIILPYQDDPKWCTARFTGGNLFNTYFIAGGTNLFYFLPVNDMTGRKKFCVGFSKMKQDGVEMLIIGGHTTVDFNNDPIIPRQGEVNDTVLKKVSKDLKVSMNTLHQLVDEMSNKAPMDRYKYISLIDLEQFVATTNVDTLAPVINEQTGERNPEDLHNIGEQINNILYMYKNPEYLARGFKPDPKILNYVDKKWDEWTSFGIYLDISNLPNSRKFSDKRKIMDMIDNKERSALAYADDSLRNDPDLISYAILKNFRITGYVDSKLLNDFDFVNNLITKIENPEVGPDITYDNATQQNQSFQAITLFGNISQNLRNNRDIALRLLKLYGGLYTNLNKNLQNDKEIAMAAISNYGDIYYAMPDQFKNDINFAKIALENSEDFQIYTLFPDELKRDKQFLLDFLHKDLNRRYPIYQFLLPEMAKDADVFITLLSANGVYFEFEETFEELTRIASSDTDRFKVTENYELLKQICLRIPEGGLKLYDCLNATIIGKLILYICLSDPNPNLDVADTISKLFSPGIYEEFETNLKRLLKMKNGQYSNVEYFFNNFAYSNKLNNMKFNDNFKIVPINLGKKTLRMGKIYNESSNLNRKLIMTEMQLRQLLLRLL